MLLYVVALFFVAGLAWFWIGVAERTSGRTPAAGAEQPSEAPQDGERVATTALRTPPTRAQGAGDELAPFASERSAPTPATGKLGSLRGHIEVTGEEAFPRSWRLVARPSKTLPQREHAAERILEFGDGRKDFALAEIPLGGYDVFGEAQGFNGQVFPILLEPGSEHAFLNLLMVPAGVLEGRVLDAQGALAEGIPITLFPVDGALAREALSDASGAFRFEKLPDGAYELLVGRASAPLMPERRPVRFMAPRLTFPDIELPLLGEIRVRVVDSLARPLEGVEVRGSGTNGGVIEGRTDFDGRLTAKHLPAGHFRLRLEHPGLGAAYARRVAVDVVAGQAAEAPVRLGP